LKKVFLSVTNDLVVDQRVHKVCNTLTNFGYDVTLIGILKKKSSKTLDRNYKIVRFPIVFKKSFLFYAEFNIKLFAYILFKKVDIIVANDLDTLLASYLASIIRKKKLVFDAHEYFTELPELEGRTFVKKIWLRIEQFILPKIKYSYTVCESIANEYKKKYGIEMKVVMNIPLSQKESNSSLLLNDKIGTRKVIIYQGALNIGRGIELVIKSMKYIENYVFLIVGDGDIRAELIELAIKEQVSEKVIFTGRIPFNELPKYTKRADIGISLEENLGLNYYYSLPNKLFDYINAGIPIIASNLPEIKKIVLENKIGVILEDRTPENLAKIIESIFNNPTTIEIWRNNIFYINKKYKWENQESVLLSLFA